MNTKIKLLLLGIFFTTSCSISPQKNVSEKFVGQWKYYTVIPNDPTDDGSMNAIICGLEKAKDTEHTFVFHLWYGRDLVATEQDDSTLVGQNANITLKFVESDRHLKVIRHDGSGMEFQKLN